MMRSSILAALALLVAGCEPVGFRAARPPLDASVLHDAWVEPGVDASPALLDAANPEPDAETWPADTSAPQPDAAPDGLDATLSGPDAGEPALDAADPGSDATTPPPDAATDDTDAGPADAGTTGCGKFELLADDFADGVSSPTLWARRTVTPGATVTEAAGEAIVTLKANQNGSTYDFYGSTYWYDLTGSQVSLEVREVTNPATTAATFVKLGDNQAGLELTAVLGHLDCRSWESGTLTTLLSVTYDPIAHARWRLRESSGTVFFETSPDGATWTALTSLGTPAFVSSTWLSFGAGTDERVASPGRARFGPVNGGVPQGRACPLSQLTDSFTGTTVSFRLAQRLRVRRRGLLAVRLGHPRSRQLFARGGRVRLDARVRPDLGCRSGGRAADGVDRAQRLGGLHAGRAEHREQAGVHSGGRHPLRQAARRRDLHQPGDGEL
ncbi:MAG: hypothetical protein QM765_37765 [Myxococcales bacterium]